MKLNKPLNVNLVANTYFYEFIKALIFSNLWISQSASSNIDHLDSQKEQIC